MNQTEGSPLPRDNLQDGTFRILIPCGPVLDLSPRPGTFAWREYPQILEPPQ